MTTEIGIFAVLIVLLVGAFATLITIILKGTAMAVYAELEAPLAQLQESIDALPGKLADPNAAQDRAESVAAVQAKADALTSALGLTQGA